MKEESKIFKYNIFIKEMASKGNSSSGLSIGNIGIDLSNVKSINLADFMNKNQPLKYELREKPKPRYDRIPGNYSIPRYGRDNLPVFYSAAKSRYQRNERRAEPYGLSGLYETSETRRYAA